MSTSYMFYHLTTPTHEFVLPDDVPIEDIEWLRWTYSQAHMILLEKTLDDVNVDGQTLWFKMSQADTKLFDPFLPIKVQVRAGVIDGDALVSPEYTISTHEVLNEDVITS